MASTPSTGWDFGSGVTGAGSLTGNSLTADAPANPFAQFGRGTFRGGRIGRGSTSVSGSGRGRGRGGQGTVSSPLTPIPTSQAVDMEGKKAETQTAPAVTRDRSTSSKVKFPLLSRYHGKELVTVRVGDDKNQVDFMVHKSLLCAASSYFSAAPEGQFAESLEKTLTLKQYCPAAFEVLYQYLYTGVVHDASFYTENIVFHRYDVLWLRVLKLADATMFQELTHIAYDRLRNEFHSTAPKAPSRTFIDELFNDKCAPSGVQSYVVAHSAFWIKKGGISKWAWWVHLTEKNMAFGAAVAAQLIKLVGANSYEGNKSHPYEDTAFDPEIMFPTLVREEVSEADDDCLFETECTDSRHISGVDLVCEDTQIESWERHGSCKVLLLKNKGTGKCRLELRFEPDGNGVTQLQARSDIVYGSAFRGTSGRVKGSFHNIKEGRPEEWLFCTKTTDLAMELADSVNTHQNK